MAVFESSSKMHSAPAVSSEDSAAFGPTEQAPTFRPMEPSAEHFDGLPAIATGQCIADYEVVRLLGAGAFARVYLARQISLDRLVALKVSANQGSEARTLAKLEHQHIVQVFSEVVDPDRNLRLLCMQFVPGVTLATVIKARNERPAETWDGRTFLEILDQVCREPTPFDVGGLSIRSFQETCDHAELTCWIGARLAEALAHAHNQGVVHRDIKPANILVNRYGRPLLADFNVALNTGPDCSGTFGGTLSYMAPEHLDAFNPENDIPATVVDARSDLYSLNVVLYEVLTGVLPFQEKIDPENRCASLRRLASERRLGAPSPRGRRADVPELLDRLVRRCLDPKPEDRFPSAAAFMHALDGCRELLQVDKAPALAGRLVNWCQRWPFAMLLFFALLPHALGSAINITYNELLIVNKNPAQKAFFHLFALGYNALAYPVLVAIGVALAWRVRRGWLRLRAETAVPAGEAARVRRRALALANQAVLLAALGWFPGGVLFPAALKTWAGPIDLNDFVHFLISFVLSGLIALTYSYLGVQFIVLRILYPQLWSDPAGARTHAEAELRHVPWRLRVYQFLAVLIPLTGAALLVAAGPDMLSLPFRLLVIALMVVGVAGFFVATMVCNRLEQVLVILTGTEGKRAI